MIVVKKISSKGDTGTTDGDMHIKCMEYLTNDFSEDENEWY